MAASNPGPRVFFQHQLRKRRHARKRVPRPRAPELTIAQILKWADDWHARTGRWPTRKDGYIPGSLEENWARIHSALKQAHRGLPRGWTLPRLLAHHRGVPNRKALPPYTVEAILAWADAYHQRTGQWPNRQSGPIAGQGRESWNKVERALHNGGRGLSGPSSLAQLLAEHRGVRNQAHLAPFTVGEILRWADAYYLRTTRWPNADSGPIAEAPGETWHAVARALEAGVRGMPGGCSLARLLEAHRGVRNKDHLPDFTNAQILRWADAFQERAGRWPKAESGPIPEAPGETWAAVDSALAQGGRGCPGGSSLPRLLAQHRGVRNHMNLARLSIEQILIWADAHHRREGRWPLSSSGPVLDAPGETWTAIQIALSRGTRGLAPGGSSLARLLAQHRGAPKRLAPRQRPQLPPTAAVRPAGTGT